MADVPMAQTASPPRDRKRKRAQSNDDPSPARAAPARARSSKPAADADEPLPAPDCAAPARERDDSESSVESDLPAADASANRAALALIAEINPNALRVRQSLLIRRADPCRLCARSARPLARLTLVGSIASSRARMWPMRSSPSSRSARRSNWPTRSQPSASRQRATPTPKPRQPRAPSASIPGLPS